MSGACRSFIQCRMSFWRGNSWASSRSANGKSSWGGGDGEAFLALVTKSVWFKEGGVSMSQSVSRLDAMIFFIFLSEGAGDVPLGKADRTKDDQNSTRAAFGHTRGILAH